MYSNLYRREHAIGQSGTDHVEIRYRSESHGRGLKNIPARFFLTRVSQTQPIESIAIMKREDITYLGAGPAALPTNVLATAAEALQNYEGTGL